MELVPKNKRIGVLQTAVGFRNNVIWLVDEARPVRDWGVNSLSIRFRLPLSPEKQFALFNCSAGICHSDEGSRGPASLCWLRRPQPYIRMQQVSYDWVREGRGQVDSARNGDLLLNYERNNNIGVTAAGTISKRVPIPSVEPICHSCCIACDSAEGRTGNSLDVISIF